MKNIQLYEEILRQTQLIPGSSFLDINCLYLLENCGRLVIRKENICSSQALLSAVAKLLQENCEEQLSNMEDEFDETSNHLKMYLSMSDYVRKETQEYLKQRIDTAINSPDILESIDDILTKV